MDYKQQIGDVYRCVEGWFDLAEAIEMYEYATTFPKGRFVEIGSYRGRSAIILGLAAKEVQGKVFAIDPHVTYTEVNEKYPQNAAEFSAYDNQAFMENILAYGVGQYVFPVAVPSEDVFIPDIDILFIDGKHDVQSALRDLFGWHYRINDGGILAIHDNYWSGPLKCKKLLLKSPDFKLIKEMNTTMFFRHIRSEEGNSYWVEKHYEYNTHF